MGENNTAPNNGPEKSGMLMNDAQLLFVAFFAILYTLMLGYVQKYNAFDVYDAWRRKRQSVKRFLLAFLILNVLTLFNFTWIISILATVNIGFEWTAPDFLVILLVVFLSFIVNGYYRMYVSLLYRYPRVFYRSKRRIEYFTKADEHGDLPSFGARFWPGLIYIFVPNGFLLLLFAIRNPTVFSFNFDLTLVIYALVFIVVVLSVVIIGLSLLLRRREKELRLARTELAKCLEEKRNPSASPNAPAGNGSSPQT